MKKFISILSVSVISLTIIRSAAAETGSFLEKEGVKDNNYTEYTEEVKDSFYNDYITDVLESAIESNAAVLDCEIDMGVFTNNSNKINLKVVAKDGRTDDLERDIKDYISEALEVSCENITLNFD